MSRSRTANILSVCRRKKLAQLPKLIQSSKPTGLPAFLLRIARDRYGIDITRCSSGIRVLTNGPIPAGTAPLIPSTRVWLKEPTDCFYDPITPEYLEAP